MFLSSRSFRIRVPFVFNDCWDLNWAPLDLNLLDILFLEMTRPLEELVRLDDLFRERDLDGLSRPHI